MKKIKKTLLTIILLFSLVGCGKEVVSLEEYDKVVKELEIWKNNYASIEKTENLDDFITPGKTFSVNGLKITFNECDLNFTDYEDEYGWYKPDDGKKYVMASFTYNNESNSDKYVSIYDFNCYADGTVCEQTYYFDTDFINANISPNRNVSFRVFYVVPIDCNEIELEYETNLWTGEKQIIKLQ